MRDVLRIINGLVRHFIIFALTATIIYLACHGIERAIEALIVSFVSLISFLFGEKAGLQIPGQQDSK
jgi:hypothetical protein